ncbi:MAG: cytochrome P450 [Oscillatoria sp. Prado101]|jgi:cytochrome P450|nr:cytochrome P450 [Oscillatoria sp. Prado101]
MKLPSGPQTLPLIQQLQWIASPLEYLETSAKAHGETFTARLGPFKFVMLSDPQAIQKLFTADPKLFATGEVNGILRPLVGDQSVILLDGFRHQRQRQLLTPPFHGERMRAYGNLICDITLAVISQRSAGKPFPVRSATQEITLRVILDAVFGMREGERLDQLRSLLTSMLDSISSPWSSALLYLRWLQRDLGAWSPWGRFLRQQQQIDNLIYAEIQQRREQPDASRTDILSLLMSAVDAESQPMTDQELRDELITLLFAGHETTASALAWALYWIYTLPEVREKLLSELDSLGGELDPNAVAKLPYLNAVCSETLRIYPVGMLTFPRKVKAPVEIGGWEFEPGAVVIGNIYLTHHREDIYPEPKRFKPERFLEKQFSPYEYLPFGGGNRRCIGMAFALFEMKLALATIVSRYEMAMADSRPVKPVRRGVTLAAPAGMAMAVTGERQPQVKTTLVPV